MFFYCKSFKKACHGSCRGGRGGTGRKAVTKILHLTYVKDITQEQAEDEPIFTGYHHA